MQACCSGCSSCAAADLLHLPGAGRGLITIVMALLSGAGHRPLRCAFRSWPLRRCFLIPSTTSFWARSRSPSNRWGGADRGGVAGHAPATVRGGLARAGQSGAGIQGQPLHADCRVDLSTTNPLDAKLVKMMPTFSRKASHMLSAPCISFYLLAKSQKVLDLPPRLRNVKWIVLAGLFDAVSLLFQLASYVYSGGKLHTVRAWASCCCVCGMVVFPRTRDYGQGDRGQRDVSAAC